MRAATNMRPAMRPVEYWVTSPNAAAALAVVELEAATEEVAEAEESVEVDTARVVEALADADEEVVLLSLAFLVPQFMAFLQAR